MGIPKKGGGLANSLKKNQKEIKEKFPLSISYCNNCALVQLNETINKSILFDHYVWVTGTSKTTVDHSHYFFRNAMSRIAKLNPYVVEIASNDGTFLKRFQEAGCQVLGVDPAENIAEAATKDGIPTIAKFFNEKLAEQHAKDQGLADLVIARNVINAMLWREMLLLLLLLLLLLTLTYP